MTTLADDLLTLSGLDEGSTSLRADHLDLRTVVRESNESLSSLLRVRNLNVSLNLPTCPVYVEGDASHLERAVANLISNAVKFTPDGGSVTVCVEPSDGQALVRVADTRIGIPAAEVDEVFARFFRSTNAQDSAIQGTGLGLSIVEAIVSAHSGTIDVISNEGSGTTFTMRLPAA